MKRTTLTLAAMIIVSALLAACGAGVTPDASPTQEPTAPASPSLTPSEDPAPSDDADPEPVGTLTAADGSVADGPGIGLDEALDGDLSQPVLVRGVLFLDTDGEVYLADSIEDASAPTFGTLRVRVANYPTDGPTWDMAESDVTGLQEVNGVRFFADTKLYGTINL